VRIDGLAGLADSARLIEGLLDRYWEHGFPQPDEDGLEGRSAPIGGLAGEGADGTLMQPLRRLPLFRRPDGKPVGLYLWQAAEEAATLADEKRREARYAAGVPELAALENEARGNAAQLRGVAAAARSAGRAWAAMDAKLSERFGADAPATRRVAEVLGRMLEIGERMVGTIPDEAALSEIEAEPAEVAEAPDAQAVAAGPVAGASGGQRPLRTRDDAIRQLEELAEWFRRTEPHSPLAYTLDHAVRRARMPLPDLLNEILPDENTRTAMLTMLGIRAFEPRPPSEEKG